MDARPRRLNGWAQPGTFATQACRVKGWGARAMRKTLASRDFCDWIGGFGSIANAGATAGDFAAAASGISMTATASYWPIVR